MATQNDIFRWLDNQQTNLIETLMAWSAINSGSYHHAGLLQMAETLTAHFTKLLDTNAGDVVEMQALPELTFIDKTGKLVKAPSAPALWFSKRPHCEKQVLLCGHYDTVFPSQSAFQQAQFLDDNTLNGPGVADMKGGILVMSKALEAFEKHPEADNIGWTVLLVPDEEIGSTSSADCCFPAAADKADFGMLYEPSLPSGAFVGKRKGSGNFSVVVRGRSAHAGREFEKGRNAIVKAAAIISEIHALNQQFAPSTINVGVIEGGQALNVVPDLAIFKFNIRVEENHVADEVLTAVEQILARHRSEDFQVALHGKVTRPVKPMDASQQKLFSLLENCCKTLGVGYQQIDSGGCCDGNNLKHLGLPNIDTLGVRGANIHTEDELVYLDSLTERCKLSFLILQAYACGQFEIKQ